MDSITLSLSTDQANEFIDGEDDEIHTQVVELISEAVNRADTSQQPVTITITINP